MSRLQHYAILIVHGQQSVAKALLQRLAESGYDDVSIANTGETAIAAARAVTPSLVLLDSALPGTPDGVHVASWIQQQCGAVIIYIADTITASEMERLVATNPQSILLTPVNPVELQIQLALHERSIAMSSTRSRQNLEAIIGVIEDYAIFMLDRDGRVSSWNTGAKKLKGYEEAEIIGGDFALFYTDEDRATGKPARHLALAASNGRWREEGVRVRQDRTTFIGDVVLTALRDSTGEVSGFVKVTRDITAQRSVEDALLASEQHYRLVVEDQTELISLATIDGVLQFVNQAYAAHFGRSASEMVGSNLLDYVSPTERAGVEEHLRNVLEVSTALTGENRMLSARGEERWIAWTNRTVRNSRGIPIAIHSVGRDVTDRRRIEGELQRTVERFAIASSAAGLGFWEFDIASHSLVWDDQMYSLYGRARSEGQQPYALWMDSLHPDDRNRLQKEEAAALGGSRHFDTRFRVVHADGSVKTLKAAARIKRDAEGRPQTMFGVNFDVTEITDSRNRLANALREKNALLNTLHRHALVSVSDATGSIVEVNDAFCRISGFTREELLGQDHRIIRSGRHDRPFWDSVWRALNGGVPWRGEVCNRAKDGSLYWVDSIIVPFCNGAGQVEKYVSIRFDITAHKDAQRQLRESELFLERVEQVAGVAGFIVDFVTGEERWTRQSNRIHDLPANEKPSMDQLLTNLPGEARESLRAALREAREQGIGYDLQTPLVTAKKRRIWIRVIGEVECDQGVPIRIIGSIQDVTERRRAEEALRDSEQQLRMISNHIPAPISVLDADLRYRFANEAYREWFGADPEALVGTSVRTLYGDSEFATIEPTLRRVLAGETVTAERTMPVRGNTRYCHVVLVPRRNDQGDFVGLFAIHTDITPRKLAEMDLERQRLFLASTSRVAGVGGWELNLLSGAIARSEETCRIHGVVAGHRPTLEQAVQFYAPEARPVIKAAVEHGIRNGQGWDLELPFIRANGEHIWVRAVGEVEFQAGIPVRLLGAFQDITSRKHIEQKMQRDAAELQRLNVELDQFVYAASHDLRAPLRAVESLTSWIAEDDPSIQPQTAERLELIHMRVQRMTRMLNDILEYAQAGRQGPQIGDILTAAALTTDVIDMLGAPTGFRFDIDPTLDAVMIFRMPLVRILHNLIGNALKHHDRNEGVIKVMVVDTAQWLRFTIVDDGPGVPEEYRASIFEMFRTLAPRDQSEGSGMGLAMVRRIVGQQGGSCGVESGSPRGAAFWFEWPKSKVGPQYASGQGPLSGADPDVMSCGVV